MMFRRFFVLTLVLAGLGVVSPDTAFAEPTKSTTSSKGATKFEPKAKKARPKLVCKGSGKARKCRRMKRSVITYAGVPAADLRAAPAVRPSGNVHIFVPSLDRELLVNIYNDDGSYNQESLAQLDALWMCRRTKETRAVDPRLYEVLSTIYDHYGKRVDLMSGFRFQQNEGSRHFHASAMDLRVEGVSYKDLFEYVQTLDPGGMGIGRYPNMSFVHIDFRAPGERSIRWTDTSRGADGSDPGKRPSRSWVRKPNS